MNTETTWVPVTIKAVTDNAILCESAFAQDWVPRSQIIDYSFPSEDFIKGEEGEIEIPVWLAEEKEFV